jgi:hypothetical protein
MAANKPNSKILLKGRKAKKLIKLMWGMNHKGDKWHRYTFIQRNDGLVVFKHDTWLMRLVLWFYIIVAFIPLCFVYGAVDVCGDLKSLWQENGTVHRITKQTDIDKIQSYIEAMNK